MQLYEAGVPLLHIRDILWHVTLSATEIYARVSTEAKRNALESAYTDISLTNCPNGPKTPDCSTGSPTSDPPPTGYAQRLTTDAASTSTDTTALRITQHCT